MLFKKKKNSGAIRSRQPATTSSRRVVSYYTASQRQLNQFERQASSRSQNRQLRHSLKLIRKWWFWCLSGLALMAISGYLLSLSTMPHIDVDGSVTYRNLSDYKSIVEPELKKDWQNRIKPLLKSEQLEATLLELIPEASNIEVSSSWFGHYPIVHITTQTPMAVFNQKGQLDKLISNRGKILMIVSESQVETDGLPLLQNDTGIEAKEGEQFMRPDEAEAFARLVAQFQAENSVVTYTLPTTPHEILVAEAGRGYQVKFLLNEQTVRQFGALRATEKKLAEIGQTPAEYIDVRLADKAYYR